MRRKSTAGWLQKRWDKTLQLDWRDLSYHCNAPLLLRADVIPFIIGTAAEKWWWPEVHNRNQLLSARDSLLNGSRDFSANGILIRSARADIIGIGVHNALTMAFSDKATLAAGRATCKSFLHQSQSLSRAPTICLPSGADFFGSIGNSVRLARRRSLSEQWTDFRWQKIDFRDFTEILSTSWNC